MSTLTLITLIGLGGLLGANLRYLVTLWAVRRFGPAFPWGTLIVNLAGSLAIGLTLELLTTRFPANDHARHLLVTGLLGSLTTFSTLAWETLVLWRGGRRLAAALNLGGSALLGLLAAAAGLALARLVS